ncbi:MAG: helicase-related protein [Candidatus Staskawiczbacteria bacterium]|nr:helicase-related protein [Candidatus Staskawiczbacteria bacterium]
MNITDNDINQILIVSITPYFLDKEVFWFQENLKEILESSKTQSFFQNNIIFLEKNRSYNFSQFLRKLDEMGYEKVFNVQDPGEFSQRGGIIDVFPINTTVAVRLDFLGNSIDKIKLLDVKIDDEKKSKNILKKRLKSQELFSDIKKLKPNDYLVHLDHGVGKFIEMKSFDISDPKSQKYYALEYAKEDKLYVPLGLERKLSRYVGFSDPKVSRLGTNIWQKTKRKIKEGVEKLAKELLELYGKKEISQRPAYIFDEDLESALVSGFLHQETPDQIQAIKDIKHDLIQEKSMDRIICGDVGFGKTEIAIRASLMAVSNNKQTVIICPTTILANQHFNNFKDRFKKLPVKIALLSRLQTKKEQKTIIKKMKEGSVDIIICTHRILSGDVEFKDLQLLIIDDEQRFGVKQKEKLRKTRPSLDILSLSATPIPRTIYLALSSFKNITLIKTPPQGKMAIKTKVLAYSSKIIKNAIEFELKRKGQIYFLHNRVETIEKTKENIAKLVPKAKIDIIHGKIAENQMIKIMDDFQKGKTDILVATTIIENGIDLPNVNTIIIEDATKLGLSQAYQIKGRVGRSHIQGFAYLLYSQKSLTPLAKERLDTLQKNEALGSGYKIAIRDLELRGAGNILGKEQSGSINQVGLNLYSQMLSEAIEKLRK